VIDTRSLGFSVKGAWASLDKSLLEIKGQTFQQLIDEAYLHPGQGDWNQPRPIEVVLSVCETGD
jgi:hypothetical protein